MPPIYKCVCMFWLYSKQWSLSVLSESIHKRPSLWSLHRQSSCGLESQFCFEWLLDQAHNVCLNLLRGRKHLAWNKSEVRVLVVFLFYSVEWKRINVVSLWVRSYEKAPCNRSWLLLFLKQLSLRSVSTFNFHSSSASWLTEDMLLLFAQ